MIRACALPAVYFCTTLQIKHGSHVSHLCSHYIERFRSRISFLDKLRNLNNFKRYVENFLGLKEKARERGVNSSELKLTVKIMQFILRNSGIWRDTP